MTIIQIINVNRNADHPEPSQVNVDKIDIEKTKDIPEIPAAERDLYTMLHEEMITATTTTRRSMRLPRQGGASSSAQPTQAAPEAESSSSDVDSQDTAESGESES